MLHSFGHRVQHCWTRACPLSRHRGYMFPWQWFTVYSCFVRSAWMLRYGMANEESFQSLSEESTIDLSANRKRKGKAAVENPRTLKSRRWCDAEVDRLIELLEERPCLWDVFCKDYHAREKRERAYEDIGNELEMDVSDIKVQILVFPLFVTLSSSSSNTSRRARAAKHLFTVDRSCAIS